MDPRKLPFNALIVGPTNSGKTQYLLNQLRGPFKGKFDYIVLLCPTFVKNKTYKGFVDRDPHIYVIDDIEKLQQDLKNDYIINHELSSLAGGVALSCGRWLALANAALITTKHVQLETEPDLNLMDLHTEPATHPSRDKEGYPLEGIDEV